MKKLVIFSSIFIVLLLMLPLTANATLYGLTWDDKLIKIDTATGAGTLVGNLDLHMWGFGLADWGGKLYAFDQVADKIREIDPNTATIGIGLTLIGEGCISFNSQGIGFLIENHGNVGTL